jgi:chorismate mutase
MTDIKTLRNEIDQLDAQIIKCIADREALSRQIGQIKSQLNKEVLDLKREEEIRLRHAALALEYQLDSDFVPQLFKLIVLHSRKVQE